MFIFNIYAYKYNSKECCSNNIFKLYIYTYIYLYK